MRNFIMAGLVSIPLALSPFTAFADTKNEPLSESESFYSQIERLETKIKEEQEQGKDVPTKVLIDPVTGKSIFFGDENNEIKEMITLDEFKEEIELLAKEETAKEKEDDKEPAFSQSGTQSDGSSPTQPPVPLVPDKTTSNSSSGESATTQIHPPLLAKGERAETLGIISGVDSPLSQTFADFSDGTTTIVSLDIEWDPGDTVAATAEPAPEPEPEPEPVLDEVATRGGGWNSEEESAWVNVEIPAPSNSITETALQYVGYPYVYAASGPNAFDCSGFTSYVYAQHGKSIPRTSYAQGASGVHIPHDQAQPGDIVVLNGGGHVAIYLGDGMIVHASTPATGVKVSPVYGSYYFVRF